MGGGGGDGFDEKIENLELMLAESLTHNQTHTCAQNDFISRSTMAVTVATNPPNVNTHALFFFDTALRPRISGL